jgi:MinD-like ATPase involved in chromosome partitioning or flagellar assembly
MHDDVETHDIEAHWHADGGVTLSHLGQTHTFGGRDSALRFVRDVARSSRVSRSLRLRTLTGNGPASLVVSPDGYYYDESRPGVRETIPDAAKFNRMAADALDAPDPLGAATPSPGLTASSALTAGTIEATPPAPVAAPLGATIRAAADSGTSAVVAEAPRPAEPNGSMPGVRTAAPAADTITQTSPQPAAERALERSSQRPEPYVGRRRRESFVDDTPPELAPTHGWRGAAAKLGIKIEPSVAERAERADQETVSQHWPGPRTIAVVNGKGGSGKTPTTICLSATFAKWGGIGVLAWDNNQTRGTLGWRTERGQHDATTLDLIGQTERLIGPNAQMADLAHFVHHQKRDRFDVLRSQPMVLASEQRLTPAEVQAIHDVASRYYRLIVIDSGNDESDPIWQEMIRHTDQLVVATTTRDDHAEAGALLLEALDAQGGQAAKLAADSVVIINQADVKATHDDLARVRSGFAQLCREATTVRYDAGMVDGALRLEGLKVTTQRDWLRASAAVARGL